MRDRNDLTFLSTSSHARPVPSSRTPATIKSIGVQFTSPVNRIAKNGINNRANTISTMQVSLWFGVIIMVPMLGEVTSLLSTLYHKVIMSKPS
jgi:hypothetical protein